jgi:hypothetical protein
VKELLENGEAEYSYPEKTNNPNQKIRLKYMLWSKENNDL